MPVQVMIAFALGVIVGCNKDKVADAMSRAAATKYGYPFPYNMYEDEIKNNKNKGTDK